MERVSAQCMLFPTPLSKLAHFKVIQGQSSWWRSIVHGCFPIRLRLTHSLYLSPLLQYLTCNFDDLKVGQFKVIQYQSTRGQSKAHWWFPIWPPLCLALYLSRYSRYLMRNFCDLDLGRFKVIQGALFALINVVNRYSTGYFLFDYW